MEETQNHSIVLMGLKHCGKSTQGKLLAEKLEVDFFDIDQEIEKAVGKPVRILYKTKGASEFMLQEEKACDKIVSENAGKQIVVATGGGICDNPPAITRLRELNTFVFLRLDMDFSINRIMDKIQKNEFGTFLNLPAYVEAENPKTLKDVREILQKKFQERFLKYEAIADIIVDIKNAPIDENLNRILEALK
ncbi:MAG: hypothetical protein K5681_09640 [Treponema sp.]|nr:hypothetical protein [Treponema sp.]